MNIITKLTIPMVAALSMIANSEGTSPKAHIKNLVGKSPACDDKITITYHDDGNVELNFHDVEASRVREQPFFKCQIFGELVIPQGYTLAPGQFIDAQFTTTLSKRGDQSGGRLRVELNDDASSTLAMNKAEEDFGAQTLLLKNSLPTPKACAHERTITLRLTAEAMINYRLDEPSEVSSRVDYIRIPPIELSEISCAPLHHGLGVSKP